MLEHPTKDDWQRIAATFPVEKLNIGITDFQTVAPIEAPSPIYTGSEFDDLDEFYINLETPHLARHLQHRIGHIWKSYILLMFYFDMGIPDDEWSVSGEQGGIKYLPNFDDKHYQIQDEFTYYADVFYYKLFSAWDTIGHILNVRYKLGIEKRPDFHKAISKLAQASTSLFDKLQTIINDPDYKEARELRNTITHNYLPNIIGSTVRQIKTQSGTMITGGGGSYTPSATIKENVVKALSLFAETLESVKTQNRIDNSKDEDPCG